jgi:hypothetical protein
MSGLPDLNFPAFNRAAESLRKMGWDVVNPVDVNPDPQADWLECIAADLLSMKGCTAICMLEGWESSFGARIEHLVAQKLGLTIIRFSDWTPEALAERRAACEQDARLIEKSSLESA